MHGCSKPRQRNRLRVLEQLGQRLVGGDRGHLEPELPVDEVVTLEDVQ